MKRWNAGALRRASRPGCSTLRATRPSTGCGAASGANSWHWGRRTKYPCTNPPPTPDAPLETRQRFHGLEHALARLPTEHREILLLREIEEMSYEDIATVLDISLGTVKSRIARARTGLLEKMPR